MLNHTIPLKYGLVEVFMAVDDQSKVDKSTEEWLDKIEDRLDYRKWYCGHYHTEKKIDWILCLKVLMCFVVSGSKWIDYQ